MNEMMVLSSFFEIDTISNNTYTYLVMSVSTFNFNKSSMYSKNKMDLIFVNPPEVLFV